MMIITRKYRNSDYAYRYNIQTAKYFQGPTRSDQEGLIKFAQRNDKNLIPTEPTTLHKVHSKYTRYLYKIGKSTQFPTTILCYVKILVWIFIILVVVPSSPIEMDRIISYLKYLDYAISPYC